MQSTPKATGFVIALVLAGILFGFVIGRSGDPEPPVVVQTVEGAAAETITRTTTRTITRARTVTVEEEDPFADEDEAGSDADSEFDDEDEDEDTTSTTATSPGEGCSDAYVGACVPAGVDRVECADLTDEDFESIGQDPYGLDPDGDGVACET